MKKLNWTRIWRDFNRWHNKFNQPLWAAQRKKIVSLVEKERTAKKR